MTETQYHQNQKQILALSSPDHVSNPKTQLPNIIISEPPIPPKMRRQQNRKGKG